MKHTLILILVILMGQGCHHSNGYIKRDPAVAEWESLFNGKDLSGWQPKITGHLLGENVGNTFRVEEGLLKVRYDEYTQFSNQFGHLFYQLPYSHYIIATEYRFVGEQVADGPGWATKNSGIMVHSQSPESMTKDQDFPISIEVQLLGGLGDGERPTANLCTPGTNVEMNNTLITRHCLNANAPTFDDDRWVRVEVMVLGDSLITHAVNGAEVFRYEKPQIGGGNVAHYDPTVKIDGKLLEQGYIALQSESHPIDFRKIEILNLKGCMNPSARNYKSYYVKSVPESCVF